MQTYDQAQYDCKVYSYLIGKQVKKGWRITGTIQDIIIAPLDGINQYRFLKLYKETRDVKKSLQFYKGELYTVLVVMRSVLNPHELITVNLDRFLRENQEMDQVPMHLQH
jgi:hypothetical protein